MIQRFFRKFKIKAQRFYIITLITIIEILLILWLNNWDWSCFPVLIPIFIQYILIFEHRSIWSRLTSEEKEKILLSEEDVDNFVKGVKKLCDEGKTATEILKKIKKE